MRIAGFLALHREKIGTKLYGYVLAKRYTSSTDVKYYARLIGTDSTFSGLVLPTIYYCPN